MVLGYTVSGKEILGIENNNSICLRRFLKLPNHLINIDNIETYYYYTVFEDKSGLTHDMLRLKISRYGVAIEDYKFDYCRRTGSDIDVIAESFELNDLIRFLPENYRCAANEAVSAFDPVPCFCMTRSADELEQHCQ